MFHFHIIIFKCCSDTTSTSYVRSWLQHSEVFGGKPKTKLRQSNSTTTKEWYGIVLGSSTYCECVLHAPRMLCQHKKPLPLSLSQPLLHNKNCYLQAFPLKLWEYNLMTWRIENVDLFGLLNTSAVAMNENFCKAKARLLLLLLVAAFVFSKTKSGAQRPKQVTTI